jgi:outer membrane protein OmpA-like peptidoglycan-associated protein
LGAAIRFETGRDVLKEESLAILDETRAFLVAHPEITRVMIQGHTDDRGDAGVNQSLSERRARAVLQWLVEHGIESSRLESQGLGSSRPRADNDSAEGRQANRRIELHVLPTVEAVAGAVPGGV